MHKVFSLVLFESAVVNFVSSDPYCMSLVACRSLSWPECNNYSETVLFRTESSHALRLSQAVANVLHKLARDFGLTASCCVFIR